MRHQQPCSFLASENRSITLPAKRPEPIDALTAQLWAEHGWGLTHQDVAGLLVGVLVAAICLA